MSFNVSIIYLKKGFYFGLLFFIFFYFNPSFAHWESQFESFPISEECRLKATPENFTLNFSQKLEGKNEFLVGWDFRSWHETLHTQKPELGGEIVIVRCLPPGRYVTIAKGNVNKLNGSVIEAQVYSTDYDDIVQGKFTQNLVELKNLIWRPMVGDEIIPIYKQIQKVVIASPKFQIDNNDLFVKQEEGGFSYSLSEEGQNILREKFEKLKNRNGRVLVEGFILNAGDREKLRLESLMRAQAVTTFLIREYSLSPSQVVSIGYGNDWIQTGMQKVDNDYSRQKDEGIILKMLD